VISFSQEMAVLSFGQARNRRRSILEPSDPKELDSVSSSDWSAIENRGPSKSLTSILSL
jgi:hypothetical protein